LFAVRCEPLGGRTLLKKVRMTRCFLTFLQFFLRAESDQ